MACSCLADDLHRALVVKGKGGSQFKIDTSFIGARLSE